MYNISDLVLGYTVHRSEWPVATLREDCITNRSRLVIRHGCVSEKECTSRNWTLEGAACGIHAATGGVPDVFLMSFILFIGTFTIAMFFRSIRGGRFFPALVRQISPAVFLF